MASHPVSPPFRADHVGSFLRPPALLDVREKHKAGEASDETLRAAEDKAIADIVHFQEDIGLRSITDGEFRRTAFHTDFLRHLDGIAIMRAPQLQITKSDGGQSFSPPVPTVVGKVRHGHDIERKNFEYLQSVTKQTPKVTIPSPTMLHFRGGREAISTEIYPDMEEFYADVAAAYGSELKSLGEAGCRYVQFDDTNLAYLCDTTQREKARERGMDPDQLPRDYARFINMAIEHKPEGMTTAAHLCRGNFKSNWAAEGGYEPVAEVLFNELAIDAYFLEYDDARSGDFSPLRFVPKNKTVVLGLVTTKFDAMEDRDAILRRIEEAAKYLPVEQMCLSPQCGFSSTTQGNDIAIESQRSKLQLVVDIAQEVWGSA